MIREASYGEITRLDRDFLERARVKVYGLLLKKVYLLEIDFETIGISTVGGRNGVLHIDSFWVDDVKAHLKGAYALLKKSLNGQKEFYFEIEKNNPAVNDIWYGNSTKIYETKEKIVYKREIDV